MIDVDDVGNGFLFGGVVVGIILLVLYLVFSRPEIKKCEADGQHIMMKSVSTGKEACVEKAAAK